MTLLDIIQDKDIKLLREQIEELLLSYEPSFTITFEDGKLRITLNVRVRTRQERSDMLDAVLRAR